MTVIAVALGTALGFVGTLWLMIPFGLMVAAAVAAFNSQDFDFRDLELSVLVTAAIVGAAAIAATTALCTNSLVEQPRRGDEPKYAEGHRTVFWAAGVNGIGVLALSLLMAFLAPPSGALELVMRPLVWPMWFVGIGAFARWIALRAPRIHERVSSARD